MKPILEIQNISKKFRINHEQQPYLSLRDSLASIFKDKSSKEDFWALKDVSFNVMPGDTVGIIGKNGAGKSTLLKILSKITPPTSGKIVSRGRIASLLEVGTGFHPELTGRENIYMNGSILGMRRKEIQKNFDAIVDFSGVEKFLDTPLKHYSSGMQLRLAFAVAAFLENEILIIDEVLAVGDAEFQKKCMGKMEDVSRSGRTVLFVSHNLYALNQLCQKSIILNKGSLIQQGNTEAIISHYLQNNESPDRQNKQGFSIADNSFLFSVLELSNKEESHWELQFEFLKDNIISSMALYVCNYEGFRIAVIDCRTSDFPIREQKNKKLKLEIEIEKLALVEGEYSVGIYLESLTYKGNIDNLFSIHKLKNKFNNNTGLIEFPRQYRGILEIDSNVQIN